MESFDFGTLLQKHEKKHKIRPTQFVSVADGVRQRLAKNIKRRRSSRLTIFDSIRNLPICDSPKQPDPISKVEHRRMQLEKWKEEKEKKKQLAAAQKKKPFIAGVVHNPLNYLPPPKVLPSTSGRVTRSQTIKNHNITTKPTKVTVKKNKSQSFAPKNAEFKAPEIKNMTKMPILSKTKKNEEPNKYHFEPVLPSIPKPINYKAKPDSEAKLVITNNTNFKESIHLDKRTARRKPVTSSECQLPITKQCPPKSYKTKTTKNTAHHPPESQSISLEQHTPKGKSPKKINQMSQGIASPAKSQTNVNQTSTPKNRIPKSESSSEEKLRSPKSPVDTALTPEKIVEEAMKNSPYVTHSRGKANARRETMKKIDEGILDDDASDVDSVDHFRRQLNSEINRMTGMCDTWDKISEQIALPETVQEQVLGAVGQARLLMSHKLQQFAALVERCERPEPGHALVTPADLHGFWDMVFMQVENVDMRFKKLEEMRARNWLDEAPTVPRRNAVSKGKPAVKTLVKPATSRLRDVIAAARKAKQQEVQSHTILAGPESPVQAKTFEAGFFCVQSPVRSPSTPSKPGQPSLLKAVLSSEAKKTASKNSTSLAMLRASLIGKDVENSSPLAEPLLQLTPINLHATPSRSILKSLNTASVKKTGKKSIKVVLFDQSDSEIRTSPDKSGNATNRNVTLADPNINNDVSSLAVEKEKENKQSRKKSITRQDAIEEFSPVMTRSRRKSMPTPALTVPEDAEVKTPKRASRKKKALQEVEVNIMEEKNHSTKRTSRRKSAALQGVIS